VVVLGRGWADGTIELRDRLTGETSTAPVDGAAQTVREAVAAQRRG